MNLQTTGRFEIDENSQGVASFSGEFNQPSVLNLANTEVANSWTNVTIDWNYPHVYLLLIIETPFTKEKSPYKLDFSVGQGFSDFERVTRVTDCGEQEVNIEQTNISFESDSNHQVVLKLFATAKHAYRATIRYNVLAK